MKSQSFKKTTEKSEINYNYETLVVTKSRIEKGLLAIPREFSKYLPKTNQRVEVFLDQSSTPLLKKFSSYSSSTNENRIGGLKDWYYDNQIKEGDEIILQILDKEKFAYRLLKEQDFIKKTKEIQNNLDNSKDETIALDRIQQISNLIGIEKEKIFYSEFLRLAKYSSDEIRKRIKISSRTSREKTPPSIRIILGDIYKGYCQLCTFSFLKRDNSPYYEIHHLEPKLGHYPKNLVLVCANCHRQFEYANVKKTFNKDGWLIKVFFNQKEYLLKQAIDELGKQEFRKTAFI